MMSETKTTRQVPEEWPELYALAGQVEKLPFVASPGYIALGKAVRKIDDLSLKNNSYYAHSLAICGFARYLQDPQAKQDVINQGVEQLFARGKNMRSFNAGFQLEKAFQPAIRAGYRSLDRPTRLIGNYLIAARSERRRHYFGGEHNDELRDQDVRRQVISDIGETNGRTHTERRLDALAVSPQYIIDMILWARGVTLAKGHIPSEQDLEKLRDASVNLTARRICTVTSNQSTGKSGPILDVSDNTVDFIAPAYSLPNFFSPKMDTKSSVNATPMICPALHVQGVVPLAMDLTIDILEQARKELVA